MLYWLAAPTVEEEIPASELERSKMFAPSIHGIEEGLSEIEHLVRVTQVDDAQSIAGVLRRLISNTAGEGTEGKAAVRIPQDITARKLRPGFASGTQMNVRRPLIVKKREWL